MSEVISSIVMMHDTGDSTLSSNLIYGVFLCVVLMYYTIIFESFRYMVQVILSTVPMYDTGSFMSIV